MTFALVKNGKIIEVGTSGNICNEYCKIKFSIDPEANYEVCEVDISVKKTLSRKEIDEIVSKFYE